MGFVTLRRKTKGMEFHRGSDFDHFPAYSKRFGVILYRMEETMLQAPILTERTPRAAPLFPLSPEAVRALRGRQDVTQPAASGTSKDD